MLAPTGSDPASRARAASGLAAFTRALGWTESPVIGLALAALTIVGCLARGSGLPDVPGTLQADESRLALAAEAIASTGIPATPGGAIYTRGLLPDYVEAAAFRTLGVSDQVARLPALVAGTLVVPATYWLARGLMAPWPAIAAATIVALSAPLITLSREAWLYPWLTLWLVLTAGWLARAHRQRGSSPYFLAGLVYAAAVFSHELAALFLPAAALVQALRLRTGFTLAPARPFWLIALPSTLAALLLTMNLRMPTAAGAGSELRAYLHLPTDALGLSATLQLLAGPHPWLVAICALGLAVLLARRRGQAPIWLPFAVALILLAFNGFVLTRRGHPRDVQALLPFLAVIAAYVAWHIGPAVTCALLGWHCTVQRFRWLRPVCGVAVILACLDMGTLLAVVRRPNVAPTWVQAMTAYTPNDIVLSFAPTQTTHYLGRTDFWMRPNGYSRYVWAGPPPPRDIYTGAVVVRNARDLETLVLARNRGRTLWVLAQRNLPADQRVALTEILTRLAPMTFEEPPTGDGTHVLRVQL